MRGFKPVSKHSRRNKYGAVRTNGYASKREAQYAEQLDLLKRAGKVRWWIEQVPVKLPGCKYVADFLVCYDDGRVALVEVKGRETEGWRIKLRVLEESRPEIFEMLEVVR